MQFHKLPKISFYNGIPMIAFHIRNKDVVFSDIVCSLYLVKSHFFTLVIPAENIFMLENGRVLELNEKEAKITTSVQSGKILVDGLGVGDVGNIVLRDNFDKSNTVIVAWRRVAFCSIFLNNPIPTCFFRPFTIDVLSDKMKTKRAIME